MESSILGEYGTSSRESAMAQMGDRQPSVAQKDEFVVEKRQSRLILENKEKIEELFQVVLSFGEACSVSDDDDSLGEQQWMEIQGDFDDRNGAKEYIKSLCNPEEAVNLKFPDELQDFLCDRNVISRIEKQSRAVLNFGKNKGEVYVLGYDSVSTTLALSALEDLISQHMEHVNWDPDQAFPMSSSKRLDQELRRLSSEEGNVVAEDHLTSMNDAIKRAILDCLKSTELEQKLKAVEEEKAEKSTPQAKQFTADSFIDLHRKKQAILTGAKGFVDTDGPSGPSLGEAARQLKQISIHPHVPDDASNPVLDSSKSLNPALLQSPDKFVASSKPLPIVEKAAMPQGASLFTPASDASSQGASSLSSSFDKYLREFATSKGYRNEEIDSVFVKYGSNMRTIDFLRALKDGRTGQDSKKDQAPMEQAQVLSPNALAASSAIQDVGQSADSQSKKHSFPDGNSPKPPEPKKRSQISEKHLHSYIDQFFQDEDSTDIEALKKRNAERQQTLKDALEEQQKKDENGGQVEQIDLTVDNDDDVAKQDNWQTKTNKKQQKKGFQQHNPHQQHNTQHQRQHQQTKNQPFKNQQAPRSRSPVRHFQNPRHRSPSPDRQTFHHQKAASPTRSHGSTANKFGDTSRPQPTFTARGQTQSGQTQSGQTQSVQARGGARPKSNLRYVIIDGSNVAMTHGNHQVYSCRGIQLCVEYFLKRGHTEITAFVPQSRTKMPTPDNPISDKHLLEELRIQGYLVFTPCRRVPGKTFQCYDDRFVLRLAQETEGVIVSNDNYRDLWHEKREWRGIIENRLLMFSFVMDIFMPPEDPLGRDGPHLDDFLSKNPSSLKPQIGQQQNTQHNGYHRQQQGHQGNYGNQAWRHPAPDAGSTSHQQGFNSRGRFSQNFHGRGQDSVDARPNNPGFHRNWQSQPRHTLQSRTQIETSPATSPNDMTAMAKAFNWLRQQLTLVFPDRDADIEQVLRDHPTETDLNKLSQYVLNYMDDT